MNDAYYQIKYSRKLKQIKPIYKIEKNMSGKRENMNVSDNLARSDNLVKSLYTKLVYKVG